MPDHRQWDISPFQGERMSREIFTVLNNIDQVRRQGSYDFAVADDGDDGREGRDRADDLA